MILLNQGFPQSLEASGMDRDTTGKRERQGMHRDGAILLPSFSLRALPDGIWQSRAFIGLFCQETICVVLTTNCCEEVLNVGLGVRLGILEVIIDGIIRVETELFSLLRLCCVVQHQELVRAIFLGNVDAVWAQSVLNPKLCRILMGTALEDGGGADFEGSSVFRNDEADVVVTLQDLIDAIVQEQQNLYQSTH